MTKLDGRTFSPLPESAALGRGDVAPSASLRPEAPPTLPDRELVVRALAGEAEPLLTLIDRLTPTIKTRVARSLAPLGGGARRHDVDDFTQEIFAYLFAHRGRVLLAWKPSLGLTLEGFVRLVARRRVISMLRNKKLTPFEFVPQDPLACDEQSIEPSRSLDSQVAHGQRLELLLARLRDRVSARGLEVFRRLFIELHSPQQVAAALSLRLDCVYQWRSRLAKIVREAALSVGTQAPSARRAGAGAQP